MQLRPILKSHLASFLIAFIVMGSIYYLYYRNGQAFVNEILQAPQMSNAIVRSVTFKAKKGYYIEYDFPINGITIYSKTYRSDMKSARIINKAFPVIYNKNSTDKNEILIFPDDFEEFNLRFPDSLRWVLNHR